MWTSIDKASFYCSLISVENPNNIPLLFNFRIIHLDIYYAMLCTYFIAARASFVQFNVTVTGVVTALSVPVGLLPTFSSTKLCTSNRTETTATKFSLILVTIYCNLYVNTVVPLQSSPRITQIYYRNPHANSPFYNPVSYRKSI